MEPVKNRPQGSGKLSGPACIEEGGWGPGHTGDEQGLSVSMATSCWTAAPRLVCICLASLREQWHLSNEGFACYVLAEERAYLRPRLL